MTIRIDEVTDRRRLSEFEAEWEQLVTNAPAAEPFSTPAWVTSWLDAFWKDRPIRFLFARRDGQLIGVAPLLVDETGDFCCRGALALPVDSIAWRGEILHTEDGGEVIETMLDHVSDRRASCLTLSRLAKDSATARALPAAAKRMNCLSTWRAELSTPIIKLPSSVEEYLQSRSKHVRHELRRKQKRLERAGAVRLEIVDQAGELDRAFDDVRTIEANSWKSAAKTSFLESSFAEGFYRTMFARTAAENWARIYIMHFNGKPIAHLFGLVYRRRYYALNSSFDAAFASHSPGSVLMLCAIEDACTQQFEVLDFMGSEYRWKNEMATHMREHWHVCISTHMMSRCSVRQVLHHRAKPYARRRLPILVRIKDGLRASNGDHRPNDRRQQRVPTTTASPTTDIGRGVRTGRSSD